MNDTRAISAPSSMGGGGALGRFGRGPRAWMLRLAASPRFQSFAAKNPLLRGKARREGEEMFDLVAGFVRSQVLYALVDMGVLARLSHGAKTARDVLPDVPERNARLLLDAGVASGLLARSGASFRLTTRGAALLGVPGLVEMIRHHAVLYRDLADPSALIRGETSPELAQFWPYVFGAGAAEDPDAAQRYSDLMAQSQGLVAEDTLAAVSFADNAEVLDIGGGTGAFLTALGQKYTAPTLHLFDLPAVVPGAESRFRSAGLTERARMTPGSFRDDPLPRGADTISLVRVLYDHSDTTVMALLRKVREALPEGGRLVISEPMTGGPKPTVAGDIYFAFYTFCMETGRARSQAQIAGMLRDAGFSDVKCPKPRRAFVTSVVTATS